MRRVIVSISLLVSILTVPATSHALLTVEITGPGFDSFVRSTEAGSFQLTTLMDMPLTLGNFTISTCSVTPDGCSGGRARVQVEESGARDKISLTDLTVRASSAGTLVIKYASNGFTPLTPGMAFTHEASINGKWDLSPDGSAPAGNQIVLNGFGNAGGPLEDLINPPPEPGTESVSSKVQDMFDFANVSFFQQQTEDILCTGGGPLGGQCQPSLRGELTLIFAGPGAVTLPGSSDVSLLKSVPEPPTLALLTFGLAGLALLGSKRLVRRRP